MEQRRSAGPVRPDSIDSDHCMGDEGAILPGNRVWLPPLARILVLKWPESPLRSAFSRNQGVLLGFCFLTKSSLRFGIESFDVLRNYCSAMTSEHPAAIRMEKGEVIVLQPPFPGGCLTIP